MGMPHFCQPTSAHPYDIPYLRTLRDRLWDRGYEHIGTVDADNSTRWQMLHSLERDLEQLPYCLAGSYHAVQQLATVQEQLVESIASEGKFEPGSVYLRPPECRDEISFPFDAFLDFARRTQNAITRYLHRALNQSVPASLSHAVKNIRTQKLLLPGDRPVTLDQYWTDSGERS